MENPQKPMISVLHLFGIYMLESGAAPPQCAYKYKITVPQIIATRASRACSHHTYKFLQMPSGF